MMKTHLFKAHGGQAYNLPLHSKDVKKSSDNLSSVLPNARTLYPFFLAMDDNLAFIELEVLEASKINSIPRSLKYNIKARGSTPTQSPTVTAPNSMWKMCGSKGK